MRNPLSRQHDSGAGKSKQERKPSAESLGIPTNGAAYFQSLKDLETVEYVRCKIRDCHILKVPSVKSVPGWSATELTEEIWQGTVKVVDRGTFSGVVFLDRATDEPVAVCPLEDEVERCTDSSRYFILKVKNAADGKVSRVGLAFNERTQAFDFNVALATSRKELEDLSKSMQPAEDIIEPDRTGNPEVNVETEIQRPKPSIPSLHFPFLGKHQGLLKPPKNDTNDIRRKSVDKPRAMDTEIPDFANFDSNGDEAALHFQQTSSFLTRLCCATY